MRKFIYILFAAAAVVFISCDKNNQGTTGTDPVVTPDVEYINVTFGVSREDVSASEEETKAYFLENWKEQYWRVADRVSVWSNAALAENRQFENKAGDGRNAEFTGEVALGTKFHILYPYNSSATITDGKIITSLPAVQTVTEGHSCDDDALLSAGIVEDVEHHETIAFNNNVRLNNYFSIIRIQIPNGVEDITSVMIEGNNGEVLAGDVEISLDGQTIESKEDGEKATTITLKPSGETFAPGYYGIAVIPTAFEKGFKLVIKHSGSNKCSIKNVKAANTATRNAGLAFPALSLQDSDYKYYYILTWKDLDEWNKDGDNWESTDVVYLGADIDCTPTLESQGKRWRENQSTFSGTFDGRKHRIYNISSAGVSARSGFIRNLTGKVKNVCFGSSDYDFETGEGTWDGQSKFEITGAEGAEGTWYYCGPVSYIQTNGVVDGVVNFATVEISCTTSTKYNFRLGGIAGTMKSSTTIQNCTNFGTVNFCPDLENGVEKTSCDMGGIVSRNDGSDVVIASCINNGTVTNNCPDLYKLGGIIGSISTTSISISDCTNNGDVINNANMWEYDDLCMGGIVGRLSFGTPISNMHNTGKIINNGSVKKSAFLAGIIGYNKEVSGLSASECTNAGDITLNGNVEGSYCQIGGITGGDFSGTMSDCNNSGKITIENVTITGEFYCGGLQSWNKGFAMSNLINTGDIICETATLNNVMHIGGVSGGEDRTSTATHTNLRNEGEISLGAKSSNISSDISATTYSYIGGVTGGNKSELTAVFKNCTNTGHVYYKGKHRVHLGGVVGCVGANPTGSSCQAKVEYYSTSGGTNMSNVGGVVGYLNITSISDLKFDGTLVTTGSSPRVYTGGIVGSQESANVTFTNCKVGGSVKGVGDGTSIGLFCAISTAHSVSFNNCVVKTNTVRASSAQITAASQLVLNPTDKTSPAMVAGGTFSGGKWTNANATGSVGNTIVQSSLD